MENLHSYEEEEFRKVAETTRAFHRAKKDSESSHIKKRLGAEEVFALGPDWDDFIVHAGTVLELSGEKEKEVLTMLEHFLTEKELGPKEYGELKKLKEDFNRKRIEESTNQK